MLHFAGEEVSRVHVPPELLHGVPKTDVHRRVLHAGGQVVGEVGADAGCMYGREEDFLFRRK